MPDARYLFPGSVKLCAGSGEVISSTSYESTSISRSDRTSCELQSKDAHLETNYEVNRLLTSSETNNNSNSKANMRTRAMRLSEQREEERLCDDFMNSVSANSNNNAAPKRGARQITMWKASSVTDDGEDKPRTHQSSNRISSMFGKYLPFFVFVLE